MVYIRTFGNVVQTAFPKNSNFLYVLNRFDALISKIIFKNKKNHFDTFRHEKHFEKQPQPQPHSQTGKFAGRDSEF